jgi:glycosyltransferase involved in cell wall biosynthesis
MNDLLSVCIPACNRPRYLKRLLKDLLPQAEKYKVAVYVSDDSRNNECKKVVEGFDYNFLFYSKNKRDLERLGKNHINAMKQSKSKFSWLLGQDETILPKSIKVLLDVIKKEPSLQLIWVNGLTKKNNSNVKLMPLKDDIFFDNCVEFFYQFRGKCPTSTAIVDTKKFNESSLDKYIKTAHPFQSGFWEYLADCKRAGSNKIKVISAPLFIFGRAKKTWLPRYIKVMYYDRFYCLGLYPKIYQKAAKKCHQEELKIKGSLKQLLKDRCIGYLDTKAVEKWFVYFPFFTKLKAVIICKIPLWLAKRIYYMTKLISIKA